MRDISAVVTQLRAIRQAQQTFLHLWAMEEEVIFPGLDRIAADMKGVRPTGVIKNFDVLDDPRSADE